MTAREIYEWAEEHDALDKDLVIYDEQEEPNSVEIDYVSDIHDIIVCSTRWC